MTFLHSSSVRHPIESIGDFVGRNRLSGAHKTKPFSMVSKLTLPKSRVFRGKMLGSQRFVFDSKLENLDLTLGSASTTIRLERIRSDIGSNGQPRHRLSGKARVVVTVNQQGAGRPLVSYKVDVPSSEASGGFVRYRDSALESHSGRGPLPSTLKNRSDDDVTATAYVRRYGEKNSRFANQSIFKLNESEINQALKLKIELSERRPVRRDVLPWQEPDSFLALAAGVTSSSVHNPSGSGDWLKDLATHFAESSDRKNVSAEAAGPAPFKSVPSSVASVPETGQSSGGNAHEVVDVVARVDRVASKMNYHMPDAQRLIDAKLADACDVPNELSKLESDTDFLLGVYDELEGLVDYLSELAEAPGSAQTYDATQVDVVNFESWVTDLIEASESE